jgi:hypothetical protein
MSDIRREAGLAWMEGCEVRMLDLFSGIGDPGAGGVGLSDASS